jgi:hypothetical protein
LAVIAAVTLIVTLTVQPHPENRLGSEKIAPGATAAR